MNPATVPSLIYTYMGRDGEQAPKDTTVLKIDSYVTVIKANAFLGCDKITKCIMHDGVHTIEEGAFCGCTRMKVIRLSRSLTHIGGLAFCPCDSLQAVFLPPTINQIDAFAFMNCNRLRILSLPPNIDMSKMGNYMLLNCFEFLQTTGIQRYNNQDGDNDRVHQEIIDFYRNQVPPLHKVCLDTNVTRQTILECINTHGPATVSIPDHDGMTPLHILALNPHADIGALCACLDLNMDLAIVQDNRGNTPLDYLKVHRDSIDDHTFFVKSLCMRWYATEKEQMMNE